MAIVPKCYLNIFNIANEESDKESRVICKLNDSINFRIHAIINLIFYEQVVVLISRQTEVE